MNTPRQFWSLVKFQMAVSPFAWALPMAFCAPLLIMAPAVPTLNMLLMSQNLFLVFLFGGLILVPEIFAAPSSGQATSLSTEFLSTRAVDKRILARSRSALFYLLATAVPLAIVLFSLRRPDLRVEIYSKVSQTECLRLVPGSSLVAERGGLPGVVAIPRGNVLVAAWRAWEFLALSIAVQAALLTIHPLKFRRPIFWFLFLPLCLAPIASTFPMRGSVPWDQEFFFRFAASQPAFWAVTVGGLVLGQLWCERRFQKLEL